MKKIQKKKAIKPTNPVNVFVVVAFFLILTATVIIVLNNQYGFDGKKKPIMKWNMKEVGLWNLQLIFRCGTS
jgi:hypothetical protein